MNTVEQISYAFISDASRRKSTGRGDGRLINDLEFQISNELGVQPKYAPNNPNAVEDDKCVIISINPDLSCTHKWDKRWIGVYARNDVKFDPQYRLYDYVFDISFYPLNILERFFLKSESKVLPVHVLPVRTTPKAIAIAAKDFQLNSPVSSDKKITALVIGDINWQCWDEHKIANRLHEFAAARNGHIVLTTSHRTMISTAKRLENMLKPWLVHSYVWGLDDADQNPYLAYLGLADEILVTADSLSMVSDVIATGKPYRLIHDWDKAFKNKIKKSILRKEFTNHVQEVFRRILNRPNDSDALIKLSGPKGLKSKNCTQKFAENLLRHGAKDIYDDDFEITPAPRYDTGLPKAIRSVAEAVRAKAAELSRK